MLSIAFIGSGSKGNATLIKSSDTLIMIDDGLSKRRINEGLALFNASISDIKAIFITHNHSDHIKGLEVLGDDLPIYAGVSTFPKGSKYTRIRPYKTIKIGSLAITPIGVSHDAPNPLNYIIEDEDESLGYVTDTGYLSDKNLSLLENKTYYLLESNHDVSMELNSKRSRELINRVLSDVGHLSNAASAGYACKIIGSKTKAIYLGHISEDCNTSECALNTYRRIFNKFGVDINSYQIIPTKQNEIVKGGSW